MGNKAAGTHTVADSTATESQPAQPQVLRVEADVEGLALALPAIVHVVGNEGHDVHSLWRASGLTAVLVRNGACAMRNCTVGQKCDGPVCQGPVLPEWRCWSEIVTG